MDARERLLAVLRSEPVDRVPCISPMQTGTLDLMRACDSYWPAAHDKPAKMARLALAAHRYAGLENARVPFDVNVDASAFGIAVSDRSLKRHPATLENRLSTKEDFKNIESPDPRTAGKAPVVLEAIRLAKGEERTLPIICGIASPHMLAFQLRGEQEAAIDMRDDPIFLKSILLKAKIWAIDFGMAAAESGADAIALIDPYASGDFLTPEQYKEFAWPYQSNIFKELGKLDIPTILHICGNTTADLELMISTGANGLSIDHEVDITYAKRLAGRRTAVIGNICPTTILLGGRPAEVVEATKQCLLAGVDAVAPGCGFALETPLGNMKAMVEATREFGGKEG
jgi:[methyl-Co(III) methylamine-specific corrinoid protein]:coenzyme M methyltransferase